MKTELPAEEREQRPVLSHLWELIFPSWLVSILHLHEEKKKFNKEDTYSLISPSWAPIILLLLLQRLTFIISGKQHCHQQAPIDTISQARV